MLFQARFWPLIVDGSVTVTFRRWRRRQVVTGHRYRTGHRIVGRQMIEVDAVEVIDPARSRTPTPGGPGTPTPTPCGPSCVVTTSCRCTGSSSIGSTSPTPRSVLAASDDLSPADRAEIDRRLDRLDRGGRPRTLDPGRCSRSSPSGPGRRAADLAAGFGRETLPFKTDVRKLKNLGLTESLEVGYRLSPWGEAYLGRGS